MQVSSTVKRKSRRTPGRLPSDSELIKEVRETQIYSANRVNSVDVLHTFVARTRIVFSNVVHTGLYTVYVVSQCFNWFLYSNEFRELSRH